MTEHNDAAASRFREVALPYLDDVYRYARFLTQNQADAENAVQECFSHALNGFDTFRGPSVKPWLFGILRSICCHETGSSARRRFRQEPRELSGSRFSFPDNEALVGRLVDALPSLLREIIVLRECHRMSYREIADVTGIPPGRVLTHLARARAMLRAGCQPKRDEGREQSGPIRHPRCDVA